jgi:hypothetical protein
VVARIGCKNRLQDWVWICSIIDYRALIRAICLHPMFVYVFCLPRLAFSYLMEINNALLALDPQGRFKFFFGRARANYTLQPTMSEVSTYPPNYILCQAATLGFDKAISLSA